MAASLYFSLCARITPAITIAIPAILNPDSCSCPRANAPIADMAGIRAEKIFVLVIPRLPIEYIHKPKQRQEHRMARLNSGRRFSHLKSSAVTPSVP